MTLLCIEYKIVTVPYFLDDMQNYELSILIDKVNVSVRNDWEIARQLMWSNMAMWSKKKLKPTDVMSLPWDNIKKGKNNRPKPKIEVTQELKDKMVAQAKSRKELLIKQGLL